MAPKKKILRKAIRSGHSGPRLSYGNKCPVDRVCLLQFATVPSIPYCLTALVPSLFSRPPWPQEGNLKPKMLNDCPCSKNQLVKIELCDNLALSFTKTICF